MRNINISGKNSTNINHANIGNTVKFIDAIKYYQTNLWAVAASASKTKKDAISCELEFFFFFEIFYLKKVCGYLPRKKRTSIRYCITREGCFSLWTCEQFQ